MLYNFNFYLNTITNLSFIMIKFLDFLIAINYFNITFAWLVVLLIFSFVLTSVPNIIYKIVNLSYLSLVIIAIWIIVLGNNILFMFYVLAFIGAVIMLFLSVVMMLPSSVVSIQPQVNFVFFIPFFILSYSISYIYSFFGTVGALFLVCWVIEVLSILLLIFYAMYILHKKLTGEGLNHMLNFYQHVFIKHIKQIGFLKICTAVNIHNFGKFLIIAYRPLLSTDIWGSLSEISYHNTTHKVAANSLYETIANQTAFNKFFNLPVDPAYTWLFYYDGFVTSLVYRMCTFFKIKKQSSMDKEGWSDFYNPLQLIEMIENKVSWFDLFFHMEEYNNKDLWVSNVIYRRQQIQKQHLFVTLWVAIIVFLQYAALYAYESALNKYQDMMLMFNANHFYETASQTILSCWLFFSVLNWHILQTKVTNIYEDVESKNEGILGIKYILYEVNPLLVWAPVIVLLVALISAVILSKKIK